MYRQLLFRRRVHSLCYRFFSSETLKNDELEKEKSLRENVLTKYPHLRISPMTSLDYGSFSDSQSIANSNLNHRSSGGRTFFLLCVAGFLAFETSRLMRASFSKNNLSLPLWTGSNEEITKHFLFVTQFDKSKQESLLSKFTSLRRENPLLNFFSWVETEEPDFCRGKKYTKESALAITLNFLKSNDLSMYVMLALKNKNLNPQERIDSFIDSINVFSYTGAITGLQRHSNQLTSNFSGVVVSDHHEEVVHSPTASNHITVSSSVSQS